MSQRPHHPRRQLSSGQTSELIVIDKNGENRQVIYETAALIEAPNWTADGKWLVYNSDGRLFKISPDGQDGPHRINTAPIENLNNDHCLAPDGKKIFISANDGHIYSVDIDGGTPTKITNNHDAFRHYLHGVSPDGSHLIYIGIQRDGDDKMVSSIYSIPTTGGADTMLTDGKYFVDGCEYTPDGAWIYYNSEQAAQRAGHAQIFRMRPDGSDQQQITFDERVNWFPHFPANGSIIAYISFPKNTLGHPADKHILIRTMDLNGKNIKTIDKFNGGQGSINVNSWAPDSTRLAYIAYPIG
ncbi:MAG: DUF5050 domain-containing protein [Rhizobiales bacterium]|nr:DUF5050 domain-containing protein [Hyphomicrobiales bacterium]